MPKIKEAVAEKPNRTEELLEKVLEGLTDLKNAIARPITSEAPTLRENLTESVPPVQPLAEQAIPVPTGYREVVDSVLNKSFGLELESHRDAPLVTVTIVVPDKYSPMTPQQREIQPRDIRPKVITLAGGVNELKEWADLVYKNFTPEIQAMIVADRSQNA